jgi:predicted nucleotidyltransferase
MQLTPDGIETADLEKNRIIKDFEILVQGWMQEVNKKRDQTGQARVVLYGSKASKTSLKSDDIDLLIVTPPYVDR